MNGLRNPKFHDLLVSRCFSKIYVSEVSKHLLKNDACFSHLSDYVESIPLEQPTIIRIPNNDGHIVSRVVVTLVTAGHCPGSVMIYIEGENGRVLYTGDFRLPIGDSARLINLHDEEGRLKPLEALYVDTTFCKEEFMHFPTREQGLESLISLIEPWLSKGPDHIIEFICPAKYNYEFVFVELYKKFNEKIHVTEEKLKLYEGIKVIQDAVTSIATESRIHACKFDKTVEATFYISSTPCGYCTKNGKPVNVKYIKLCAQSFKNYNPDSPVHKYFSGQRLYRVCFSTHSSLAEIRDLVHYLKPKIIYPNVVRKQTVTEILELIHGSPCQEANSPEREFSTSPLGQLKKESFNDISSTISISLPFYDDSYKIIQKHASLNVNNIESQISRPEVTTENNNIITHLYAEVAKSEAQNLNSQSNVFKNSPLKWLCPLSSSSEENCDPNSYGSSKDKSDSETTYETSEEQFKILNDNLDANINPLTKKLKSFKTDNQIIIPPNNNVDVNEILNKSTKQTNSSDETCRDLFVHNISSQDLKNDSKKSLLVNLSDPYINVDSIAAIQSDVLNSKICLKSLEKNFDANTCPQTCESRFVNEIVKDEENQKVMRFVKSVEKIFEDDCHTSLDLVVTKTSSHAIANIENSTVIDHGINLTEPSIQILDKQSCHSNELLIDVLEEVQSSPELEIITTKICSKNMQQNTGGLNSGNKYIEEKQISNTSNSDALCLDYGKKITPVLSKERSSIHKNKASTKVQTFAKHDNLPNKDVEQKDMISNKKKFLKTIVPNMNKNLCTESTKFIRKLSPKINQSLYMFSQKLPDISASKFERNISKVKQKSNEISNLDNRDLIFVGERNKNDKEIEIIDLSSDDSDDCNVKNAVKPKCAKDACTSVDITVNESHCDKSVRSSDVEVLDDSPSLLNPSNVRKDSHDSLHYTEGSRTKRKCSENEKFPSKKSPKCNEEDSHDKSEKCDMKNASEDYLFSNRIAGSPFYLNQNLEKVFSVFLE
ncbi:protein artemis [Caerostris darwini]|uniref:Protein artemis n=1 Tax=Caerostris darwini TaxID=1538125 RepID=A0AAV4Q5Q2_9ARAC|nr:protein artemis [Caerostris darwini]